MVDPWREAAPAWQRHGLHGADDQDGVDGAVLDGERVEQCADGAAAPRTTAPGSQAQASRRLGHAGERGRDGGRIILTMESTSRLPVVAEMSRARWPSSPTARSRGCLHRASNAQAVSKTGEAARSHVTMASASCIALASRLGGRGVYVVGQARERASHTRGLVRVRLQHAHRPRARSGRADRKLRALHAWLPSEPGGTPAVGGLVSLDSKRLVTKLIAGWIVLPAL